MNAKSVITAFGTNAVINQMTCAMKYAMIGNRPDVSTPENTPTLIAGKYWSSWKLLSG